MTLEESITQIILQLKKIKVICDKCPKENYCEGIFITNFHPAENITEVIENLTIDREELIASRIQKEKK